MVENFDKIINFFRSSTILHNSCGLWWQTL